MGISILDGTRKQRQAARAKAGSLRTLQLQPATLKRYRGAVNFFFNWLEEVGEQLPSSVEATDEILGEFLEECWAIGESRALVGDTLSGIQHFIPQLRRGLNDAWRLYGTWCKNEVPSRAKPLLARQVLAMAGYALEEGDQSMAAGLLVAFNGFLRPCEAMLTSGQCTFDLDQGTCHINLGLTKGGKRAGIPEHVIIDDLEAVHLLAQVLAGRAKGKALFPRKTPCFRAGFKKLLGKIGADPQRYKPYSLRRGGATHHWHVLGNLSRTTLRGRWRHQQTCRIYIQDGVAMLEQLRLSARELKLIAKGCALLRRLA